MLVTADKIHGVLASQDTVHLGRYEGSAFSATLLTCEHLREALCLAILACLVLDAKGDEVQNYAENWRTARAQCS